MQNLAQIENIDPIIMVFMMSVLTVLRNCSEVDGSEYVRQM